MARATLTLLVEDLEELARAVPRERSWPTFERFLARGRCIPFTGGTADGLRMGLFNYPLGAVPVAALTGLAEEPAVTIHSQHYLRVDVVSLRADMTRVFMTGHGMAGLSTREREEIRRCVENVLAEEGLEHFACRDECWILASDIGPGVEFMPLGEALGLNLADALPAGLEARDWRRIMNEAQVALYNNPVNESRRQAGLAETNGIWIWGGGYLPEETSNAPFDKVYSTHPVSRGLSLLNRCEVLQCHDFNPSDIQGERVLLDWTVESRDAAAEMDRLESLAARLLAPLGRRQLSLRLVGTSGRVWDVDRQALRRFWRRSAPLWQSMGENAE